MKTLLSVANDHHQAHGPVILKQLAEENRILRELLEETLSRLERHERELAKTG